MAAKQLTFDEDARNAIKRGVDSLANAVKVHTTKCSKSAAS